MITTVYNISEVKENLNIGKYGEYLCNYNKGYISEILYEIADNEVDIYYHKLLKWAIDSDAGYYCEEAVKEGFFDCSEKDFSLIKLLQSGQYLQIKEELDENYTAVVLNYILTLLEKNQINSITEEQLTVIEEEINNYIDNIVDILNLLSDIFEKEIKPIF